MIFDKESVILSNQASFETVLDRACERLWGKKIQYSIRRIRELETALQDMEQELDAWLGPTAAQEPPRPTGRSGSES